MTDETKETQPEEPKPPTELEIEVRKGQMAKLPWDKAQDLIRKGMGFERNSEALKEEKRKLKEAASLGEELLKLRESDPERAKRIWEIANGKEGSPPPKTPPVEVDEQDLSDTERKLLAHTRTLEARLAEIDQRTVSLHGELSARQQAEAQRGLEQTILREASAIGHWDETDRKEMLPLIAAYLSSNEDASVTEAVYAIADRDAQRLQRKSASRAGNSEDRRRFATLPTKGAPRTTEGTKPPSTGQDLMSGKVLKYAMDSLLRKFN